MSFFLSLIKSQRKSVALIAFVFCVTRIAVMGLGLQYPTSETIWLWQILDLDLLHHHLGRSLLHLQSQPPLLNTIIGLAEKAAGLHFGVLVLALQLVLALSSIVCIYLLLIVFNINTGFSLLVSLFLLLNPSELLFEFDPLYTQLVVALLCFLAMATVCFVHHRSNTALYSIVALAVTLTLTRSSYQWIWIVGIFATIWWQVPKKRVQICRAGLFCVALSLVWPAKNQILFHHFSSTTWGPYSMSKHWSAPADPRLQMWIGQGQLVSLTPYVESDEELKDRLQSRWQGSKTGFPELDDISKHYGGATNWNSLAMLHLNDAMGKDVVFLLKHDPKRYVVSVLHAVAIYFSPSSIYFTGLKNEANAAQYGKLSFVDIPVLRVCCNVFGLPEDPALTNRSSHHQPRASLSTVIKSFCFSAIVLYALFFACLISFNRRSLWQGAAHRRAVAIVITVTVMYSFIVGNLVELGENERFRFETQDLVVIVVAIFLQQLWDRRRSSGVQLKSFSSSLSH